MRDVKKLQQDIKNDPIIKDPMANRGCLLVCTFGNFLASVLLAAHTVSNLDLNHEQIFDNESYESGETNRQQKRFLLRILYQGLRYRILAKFAFSRLIYMTI